MFHKVAKLGSAKGSSKAENTCKYPSICIESSEDGKELQEHIYGVNAGLTCLLTYHDHTRFDAAEAESLLSVGKSRFSEEEQYSHYVTIRSICKPPGSCDQNSCICSISRMCGKQAVHLLECAVRMICQDGIIYPEVHMSDIISVHLSDIDSVELQLHSKQDNQSFRCTLANVGNSKLYLRAYFDRQDSCPISQMIKVPSFMPLDTWTDQTLVFRLDLDNPHSYSLLLWAPSSCMVVSKVCPILTNTSSCLDTVKVLMKE